MIVWTRQLFSHLLRVFECLEKVKLINCSQWNFSLLPKNWRAEMINGTIIGVIWFNYKSIGVRIAGSEVMPYDRMGNHFPFRKISFFFKFWCFYYSKWPKCIFGVIGIFQNIPIIGITLKLQYTELLLSWIFLIKKKNHA